MVDLSDKAPNCEPTARAQAAGEHDPHRASLHTTHPPHADEALREALRRTMLEPNMPGFDKKRAAAELIRQHLIARRALYRPAGGRAFFFAQAGRRLHRLAPPPCRAWLI